MKNPVYSSLTPASYYYESKDVLQKLTDYYIKEMYGDPLTISWQDKVGIIGELIGGSAGIYYGSPAYQYAKNRGLFLQVSFIAGNSVAGSAFLIQATRDCFERLALERHAPESLKHVLELPQNKDLIIKYLKMFFGSALCSLPMAVAAILFPLPGCVSTTCLAIIGAHSGTSHTILHAVSWELMLNEDNWFFRLPYLVITLPYKLYQKLTLSTAQMQLIKLQQEKAAIHQKYKNILGQFFTKTLEKIVNDHVNSRLGGKDYKSSAITDITAPTASVLKLTAYTAVNDHKPENSSQTSNLWHCCIATHQWIKKKGMALIGGAFMMSGCIGWEVSPIYMGLTQWNLNLWQSIAVGGLPGYAMAVLATFYGAVTIQKVYEYLTTWNKQTNKLPIEAKLYPGTFTFLLIIILYLSFFSYANAEILITTIFDADTWGIVRPILEYNAYPAMQILSFVPLLSLSVDIMRRCIAKFGPDDNKICARLLIKANIISQRLQQVHGDKLMANIAFYSKNQQKLFGIDPIQFTNDKLRLSDLDKNIESTSQSDSKQPLQSVSCCNYLGSFFSRDTRDTSIFPLLNIDSSTLQTESAYDFY